MTQISKERHNARCYALQALYQWHFTQENGQVMIHQFMEDGGLMDTDQEYFERLLLGAIQHINELDEIMSAHLDRRISALNPVELAIMRLAIYEMAHCIETPYKVVIDEALELAKEYGAVDGYKYVNAILDAVAKKLRSRELPAS